MDLNVEATILYIVDAVLWFGDEVTVGKKLRLPETNLIHEFSAHAFVVLCCYVGKELLLAPAVLPVFQLVEHLQNHLALKGPREFIIINTGH